MRDTKYAYLSCLPLSSTFCASATPETARPTPPLPPPWSIQGKNNEDEDFDDDPLSFNSSKYHQIKRHLLLGRKVMTNLDSILKSRDITLPTKVHLVKAMVFPVVMYGCESWTI